ncbi:glycosyltransferase [Cohnella sp. CFH 77786]|uniref:MGDG synthase family glycosyltransferase n=1 Tax=Cohnella sp. CFH 77786 TaxID=2662265 RepID=UPI001C610247|nr:glycosyltransferase [Cohnella sp. CFH 77786]MBW5447165.1 glycosyltransferase [Cohnella sp. CFH 77786]
MKPTTKPKILILSGALGDGHKQAARAIREAALADHPGMEVEEVDYMEWTHPRLHVAGKFFYEQWMKKLPSLYGYLFQRTRGDNLFSSLVKRAKTYSLERMQQLLMEKQPSVVVSTFPLAAAAMSAFKAQGLTGLPAVTVITDHTDHSFWIHPHTDRYIVGSDPVRKALLRKGVPADRISATGIPVRLPYHRSYDRVQLRRRHGFDRTRPTVLVMGGGLGMIDKDFVGLLKSGQFAGDAQFIVVCGRNVKLREQLEEKLTHAAGRVHVLGYVEHVHELMALSDLIVTKPGGLTTSEALSLELPMLLFKPLPGQEKDNAAYLAGIGAAVEAGSAAELARILTGLLTERERLDGMKRQAALFRPNSPSPDAVRAILEAKHAGFPVWEEASEPVCAKA